MAMNHVCCAQFCEHRPLERVETLPAYIPRMAEYADPERPHRLGPFAIAKAEHRGGNNLGHVARQLERVALGASGYTVRAEHCRHQVDDTRRRQAVSRVSRANLRMV